jgi:hypothetical protein
VHYDEYVKKVLFSNDPVVPNIGYLEAKRTGKTPNTTRRSQQFKQIKAVQIAIH